MGTPHCFLPVSHFFFLGIRRHKQTPKSRVQEGIRLLTTTTVKRVLGASFHRSCLLLRAGPRSSGALDASEAAPKTRYVR